jgi:hypothetical protein
MVEDKKEPEVKSQGIILDTILIKSLEAIIGYIAIFFFKPVWDKIIGLWKDKDESDSKTD